MGSQESIYWTFLKNLAICFEHMAMDAEDIVIFRIIKSRSIIYLPLKTPKSVSPRHSLALIGGEDRGKNSQDTQ